MSNINSEHKTINQLWIDFCHQRTTQLILKKYDKKIIDQEKEKYLNNLALNKYSSPLAILQQILLFTPTQINDFLSSTHYSDETPTNNYTDYFLSFYFAIEPFKDHYDHILKLVSKNNLLLGTLFILSSHRNNKSLLSKINKKYPKNNFSPAFCHYFKYYKNNSQDFYHHHPSFYKSILKNPFIKASLEKYDQPALVEDLQANIYYGHPDRGHPDSIVSILNDFSFSPIDPPLYRIFKQAGFNLNSQNKFGNTPAQIMLDQLSKSGDTLIFVQLLELIKAGADLTIKNSKNKSFIDIWHSPAFRKHLQRHLDDNQTWPNDQESHFSVDFILESNLAIGAIDSILEKQQIEHKLFSSKQKSLNKFQAKNKI